MSPDATAEDGPRTGLATALLGEIAALLARLAETGETGAIDLRSLPMTDADRSELDARLGRGEVSVELSVAGTSEVWETSYAGVWWIRHFGSGNRVASEEIAVTRVPELLLAHPADLHVAVLRLKRELASVPPGDDTGERSNA